MPMPVGTGKHFMDPIKQANFTTLTHAVAIGDDATVLFLLETGADPEQRDTDGRSALTLAVQHGHLKSVAYLLEYGAKPDAVDGSGTSPIQLANDNKSSGAVTLLTGAAAEIHREHELSGRRIRPRIRRKSRWSTVRTLLLWATGAAVAFGAFETRSSFNISASQQVFDAITTNSVSQVSKLLVNGVSPNVRDTYGNSALLYAANSGRMDIVRLLLKNHADPNLGTPHGIAALERSGIEHEEVVSALLDTGADPNRVDARGKSLLAYACASGRYPAVIVSLLKHKANPNAPGVNGSPLVSLIESTNEPQIGSMKALLDAGANPNAIDTASTPILVWSAEQSPIEVVNLLLQGGAKVSAVDATKRTALDAACRAERPDMVQLLLDHGANPNTRDGEGNTSVMYALSGLVDAPRTAAETCASILRLLSRHGAKMDGANSSGKTPSQLASDLGLERLVRVL